MKILTINCVYEEGSTGKIIKDISNTLISENCEFDFCYEYGTLVKEENVYRIATYYEYIFYYLLSRITGLKYGTGYTSTYKLIKRIKKKKPDIVHIHCPNMHTVNIYKILNYLKRKKIKTVITNHAEFFFTGNCPHSYECDRFKIGCGNCNMIFDEYRPYLFDRTSLEWKKMKSAFEDFKNIIMISVSKWNNDRLNQSPICAHLRSEIVHNGIDTVNVFKPVGFSEIKNNLNIKDEKILLHVTASFTNNEDDLKGGIYIIDLARKLSDMNIKIIVIGPVILDDNINIPNNIILIGQVINQEILAQYYSLADLTVIASRRETYGMVCAESLACGTPVVGFEAGGPETIALSEYSEFIEYGNVEKLKECVERWIDKKILIKDDIVNIASEFYSKEKMAFKYYEVYKQLLSE